MGLIDASALRDFAGAIFTTAGLAPELAQCVAHYLDEADLMGHATHGLALAPMASRRPTGRS